MPCCYRQWDGAEGQSEDTASGARGELTGAFTSTKQFSAAVSNPVSVAKVLEQA